MIRKLAGLFLSASVFVRVWPTMFQTLWNVTAGIREKKQLCWNDIVLVSCEGLPTSAGQMDSTQTPEERTLASIPDSYQPKARKILQAWREKGMTWNKDGNVYMNGSPVTGADLSSMLLHAATARGIQTRISTHGISTVNMINVRQPRVEKTSW